MARTWIDIHQLYEHYYQVLQLRKCLNVILDIINDLKSFGHAYKCLPFCISFNHVLMIEGMISWANADGSEFKEVWGPIACIEQMKRWLFR